LLSFLSKPARCTWVKYINPLAKITIANFVIKVVEYVKIPEERLDLLLADNEKLKKLIENSTHTVLDIYKDTCDVTISMQKTQKDPLSTWRARDVVKAIGRGFEPEIALELLDPTKELKLMKLSDYAGKSRNRLVGIRARIIGTTGKSKRFIENATDTHIEIYGKTVCIIGNSEYVHIAARAIDMLASGSEHGTVFKKLEAETKKLARS